MENQNDPRREWKRHDRWKCRHCGHLAQDHNRFNGAIRDGMCLASHPNLGERPCYCPGFNYAAGDRGR